MITIIYWLYHPLNWNNFVMKTLHYLKVFNLYYKLKNILIPYSKSLEVYSYPINFNSKINT